MPKNPKAGMIKVAEGGGADAQAIVAAQTC